MLLLEEIDQDIRMRQRSIGEKTRRIKQMHAIYAKGQHLRLNAL